MLIWSSMYACGDNTSCVDWFTSSEKSFSAFYLFMTYLLFNSR